MANWNIEEYNELKKQIQKKWLSEEVKFIRRNTKVQKQEVNKKLSILQVRSIQKINMDKFGDREYCNDRFSVFNELLPGYYGVKEFEEIGKKYSEKLDNISWLLEE